MVRKQTNLLIAPLIITFICAFIPFNLSARVIDSEIISEVTIYALMSNNAYLTDKQFDLSTEEWVKVKRNGKPQKLGKNSYTPSFIGRIFSNLQYDIWEHNDGKRTVFAYKGTDEKIDWVTNFSVGISIPYKSAKKHLKKYRKSNPTREVTVTGHSLGGGIALSMSLWENVDAYVFNTSPRVFDGLGDNTSPATRMAIYQKGDVLEIIRNKYPKFLEVVEKENIIQTNFNYSDENNHKIDLLAENLLNCSVKNGLFPNLKPSLGTNLSCTY